MTVGNYNTSVSQYSGYPLVFQGQLKERAKKIMQPVDQVENLVTNTVDTFVPESQDEETKKSHKNAIRAFSAVLVLGAFTALFNPKFSSKLTAYLKKKSTKAATKAGEEGLTGAWNTIKENVMKYGANGMQVINNANNAKDIGFKYICDKFKFLKKPHNFITRSFDKISKHTVLSKYEGVNEEFIKMDSILSGYLGKLNPAEKKLVEKKLQELTKNKEFFAQTSVEQRLLNQEKIMSNLEKDMSKRMVEFGKNVFGKNSKNRVDGAKDSFTFWAEEILKPQRTKLEEEGANAVSKIIGDGKSQKGTYQEILDILSPHLKNEEKALLEDQLKNTSKKLRKANTSECVEYFDKKRDLILGSAPTDVVTNLFWLAVAGYAIGSADSKEERLSKTVTSAFPVVAGSGVSLLLTAKLFSGGMGIALGALSSAVLSLIGSGINRLLPKAPEDLITDNKQVLKEGVKRV